MSIAFTYTVGSKHKEIIFLETESVKEYKKKFCKFIQTKIVPGYFGEIGNIRVCLSPFETASCHSTCFFFFPFIITLSTQ